VIGVSPERSVAPPSSWTVIIGSRESLIPG
jgi:hypothetical protein